MFLLGEPCAFTVERATKGRKVPSLKDSLKYLHHLTNKSENNNKPMPISERLNLVVTEVKEIWVGIGFPEEALIANDKAKSKLEGFNNRYLTLCKSKHKPTESQRNIEIEFSHLIETIFDVAKQSMENALPANLRQFLANARENATTLNKSCVGENSLSSNKRERNSKQVQEQVPGPVACRSSGRMVLRPKSTCLPKTADSSDGSSCPSVATSGSDFCPAKPKKSKTVEESVPALDRTLSTVRGAAYILKTTLTTLNAPSTPTSTSSVYRMRIKTRAKIAETIKSEFSPQEPLTVHFDSKKMKSLTGESDIERFPVLVTGPDSTSQLLGAPALNSVTGEEQATAVNELLLQWGIQSKVKCVSGDTTNSVSGWRKGAISILEKTTKSELLYLACRRHVYETLLEGVATLCTGPSQSPEVALFKKFREYWPKLDVTAYEDGPSDDAVWEAIDPTHEAIVNMANHQLETFQPRGD